MELFNQEIEEPHPKAVIKWFGRNSVLFGSDQAKDLIGQTVEVLYQYPVTTDCGLSQWSHRHVIAYVDDDKNSRLLKDVKLDYV